MSIDTEIVENSVVKHDSGPVYFQFVEAKCKPGDDAPDLTRHWSHGKDRILRRTVHLDKFWASAVRKGISLATARAWAVAGPEANIVREAQEMFLAGNIVGYDRRKVAWGSGWDCYLNQHLRSFILTGNGAFTQVVYKGARVVGFVHLDPARCERTGDAQHPVIYHSDSHEIELASHEVFMLSDFADEATNELGCGMCAAERAYDEIRIQSAAQRKYWERISGRSADTIDFISGLNDGSLKKNHRQRRRRSRRQGLHLPYGAHHRSRAGRS